MNELTPPMNEVTPVQRFRDEPRESPIFTQATPPSYYEVPLPLDYSRMELVKKLHDNSDNNNNAPIDDGNMRSMHDASPTTATMSVSAAWKLNNQSTNIKSVSPMKVLSVTSLSSNLEWNEMLGEIGQAVDEFEKVNKSSNQNEIIDSSNNTEEQLGSIDDTTATTTATTTTSTTSTRLLASSTQSLTHPDALKLSPQREQVDEQENQPQSFQTIPSSSEIVESSLPIDQQLTSQTAIDQSQEIGQQGEQLSQPTPPLFASQEQQHQHHHHQQQLKASHPLPTMAPPLPTQPPHVDAATMNALAREQYEQFDLPVISVKGRTGLEPTKDFPIQIGNEREREREREREKK
jgi:hypothetical protein